ncbi:uncharacterized protein LOC125269631 [Megalobrama amblycephala]|uniref:uncharacterized protein LOC125269631 n=1 Tax=Megalobrama amblycephala TaxID=75352 RepID=UPI002013CB18|nr:uncharacterized protein LOC125269631 [Megalobrama amblycephala]
MIASYVKGNHRYWDKWLSVFRFAVNTAWQKSTGFTPAEIALGCKLKGPLEIALTKPPNPSNPTYNTVEIQESLIQLVKENVQRAQAKQRHYYNMRRKQAIYKEEALQLNSSTVPYHLCTDLSRTLMFEYSRQLAGGLIGHCVFGDEEEYVTVLEGDSVTLNSDLTEIKDDDVIQWFGNENTVIAVINKQFDRITVYDDDFDGRFRDRLKLDNQTGSLTITDITTEHVGSYTLEINGVRKKKFEVFIPVLTLLSVSVKEGDSVTLNSDLTEMKDDDVIQWRFGNTLIAEINKRVDRITVYDDVLDGRFRDRLKLDKQTGSLTITNITTEHAGDYKLLMRVSYRFSLKAFASVYDSVHCCGPTEAVIRLVLSALVGVATVILLVYDIRSRRAEQHQAHIHT